MEQAKYIPGVCNIGPQERKLRKRFGWIGTGLFLILAAYFHGESFPKWADLLLFFPALAGSIGLLQYYQHFCVNLGLRGLFNVDKEAFQTDRVEQAEFRKMDRARAWKIILVGLALSLAGTLLAYFL